MELLKQQQGQMQHLINSCVLNLLIVADIPHPPQNYAEGSCSALGGGQRTGQPVHALKDWDLGSMVYRS